MVGSGQSSVCGGPFAYSYYYYATVHPRLPVTKSGRIHLEQTRHHRCFYARADEAVFTTAFPSLDAQGYVSSRRHQHATNHRSSSNFLFSMTGGTTLDDPNPNPKIGSRGDRK